MFRGSTVAHPLIAPVPALARPVGDMLRSRVLDRLQQQWQQIDGRLDMYLPDGSRVQFGRGAAPDASMTIHDSRLFLRVAMRGEMGAGESYVAGEWSEGTGTSPNGAELAKVVRLFLRATEARGLESPFTVVAQLPAWWKHRRAANSHRGSKRNISAHYDLGNSFYQLFLDDSMTYSSGVWRDGANDLSQAQHAKFERLCTHLELNASDHLVEIGCGWGGMAIYAAKTRGCKVTAITVSREQCELAQQRVADAGLRHLIEIRFCDYRDIQPPPSGFSKLVSIEMIEAVGFDYMPSYFSHCARLLNAGGLMALQAITMPDDRFDAYRKRVDWMQTYIFPGSLIPCLQLIDTCSRSAGLEQLRCEDIGTDYALTLEAWRSAFGSQLANVRKLGFDDPFIRTWMMYLAFSQAAFAEQTLSVHHVVLRRS
jgi:cyclopropane-fatty-acyl-phospholipid synthase